MKFYRILSLLAIFIGNYISVHAQSTWTNYVALQNDVRSLVMDAQGNIWAGAFGGLMKFDGTTWTTYTNFNSGLSHPDIYCVAIDAQGNKWLGTNGGGVIKFDGTNWTTYRTTNSSLADDYVYTIAIDAQGNKWFGNYAGVSKFDGTSWTTYNTSNSALPSHLVRSIAIDAQGKKWFGTDGSTSTPGGAGVAVYDNTNWTIYNNNSSLPNDGVWAITIDGSGNKWMGTYGMGFSKFDGTTWTLYNTSNSGLVSNSVRSIAVDAQGNKWIGTVAGISKNNGTSWTTYNTLNSGLPNNTVNAILIDMQGNKWFATGNGIAKFNGTSWVVYNSMKSSLIENVVSGIAIDAQNNKWFGTYGGVSKFDGINWTNYSTTNSGLANDVVNSITIDASGNKWIGTGGSGVSKFNGTNWTTYTTSNSGLTNDYINSITIDAQDNKWICTGWGVSKFDGATWTTYTTSNSGLSSDIVNSVAVDAMGNKWFATGLGVSKFDGTNWTSYVTTNSGLTDNLVTAIAIDAQGNKWIGTFAGGVCKFDGTSWTTYSTNNSGILSDSIYAMGIDGQGNKWFSFHYGGMSKFNGTTWTTYTTASTNKGLADNYVQSLAFENTGDKWFGTYSGVFRLMEVTGPPVITQQPVNVSTCIQNNVSFSAAATGASSYQWRVFNGTTWTNVVNNAIYTGANTPVLSLNNVPASINGYQYRCHIYNALDSIASTAATLTVYTSLTPAVTIAANPGNTICAGTSVTFTATPTNGGTPGYQWKVNGFNVGTNSPTYTTTTLTNNAVVTCVMTSSISCAVPSSATSNAITMTVNPNVVPTVTITPNKSQVCQGEIVGYLATTNVTGATYQWKVNGNNTGSNSNTHSYAPASGDQVTCTITVPTNTCFTQSSVTSSAISVAVTSPVAPTLSISTPSTTVCSGVPVLYTATSNVTGGAYTWYVNTVPVSGATGATFSYAPTNGDAITSMVTIPSGGCYTASTASANTLTMTVNPPTQAPTVSIAASKTQACQGEIVSYTATTNVPGATYEWRVNGTVTGTNVNTHSYAPAAGDQVTCTVIVPGNTCFTLPSVTSNAVSVSIISLVNSTVTVVAHPSNTICEGNSATFIATTNVTNGIYTWKVNGITTGTNNPVFGYVPQDNDIVLCAVTAPGGCFDPTYVLSPIIVMDVQAKAAAPVSLYTNMFASTGNTVNFTAKIPADLTLYSIEWKNKGVTFATTTTATASYVKQAGNDTITATIIPVDGCYATGTSPEFVVYNVGVGVNDLSKTSGIEVYPNPFNDRITVKGMAATDKAVLYDMAGRKMIPAGTSGATLIFSNIAPGAYLLKIETAGGIIKANIPLRKL